MLKTVGNILQKVKAGLSLSFNSLVALIFTPITNVLLMAELYQLQASSPVALRVYQTYSTVALMLQVMALIDRPD